MPPDNKVEMLFNERLDSERELFDLALAFNKKVIELYEKFGVTICFKVTLLTQDKSPALITGLGSSTSKLSV